MRSNISTADRLIRLLFAVIVGVLYFTGTIPGILGIVLMVAGAVLALTSVINFCPLYALLGIGTRKA